MWRALLEEGRRPATIVALFVAFLSVLASLVVSYYFYRKSLVLGEMDYQVTQVRIFDKESVVSKDGKIEAPLRLVDSTGNLISDNVFVAQVKIWNAGNGEIKKDDVRVPYRIKLPDGIRIIDLNMSAPQPVNYDGFRIQQDGTLDWSHFDVGTGAIVRLIYSAPNQASVVVSGFSAGLPEPHNISVSTTPDSIFDVFFRFIQAVPNTQKLVALISMVLALILLSMALSYVSHPDEKRTVVRLTRRFPSEPLQIITLIIFIFYIVGTFRDFYSGVKPPF